MQWRSQYRGKEAEYPPLDSEKIVKNRGKYGKKSEKREEKSGKKLRKKRKNREEKAKLGKVLSLCPS